MKGERSSGGKQSARQQRRDGEHTAKKDTGRLERDPRPAFFRQTYNALVGRSGEALDSHTENRDAGEGGEWILPLLPRRGSGILKA